MAARASLFLILIFMAKATEVEWPARWIVWNVGQGQWVTRVEDGVCWHFDMGGERAPWSQLMALCRSRQNLVQLSHWDSDHINFIGKVGYFLPHVCHFRLPGGKPSAKKLKMVKRVRGCETHEPFSLWRPDRATTSNEASSVVSWRQMLMPGDSTKGMEKTWVWNLSDLKEIKFLALGHHGSRTATSNLLLDHLPNLKLAIASARRKRYGHPHIETKRILQKFKVPTLSTEDWGHIHIW